VDGVLTVAAIVMAEDRRAHRPVRRIAKAAFLVGLCASIAANVAGAQPTLGGRLIAAWPAVALLLIVEMLSSSLRAPVPPNTLWLRNVPVTTPVALELTQLGSRTNRWNSAAPPDHLCSARNART
jgi:hypothetical protein